ncbi:hypothetical protein [Aliiroseovarius sp.]|uniref:hypothetical protein n=1 Tax=Aliiroseovarius sp. TaxID=1872442 RepID=UPI003BABDEFA
MSSIKNFFAVTFGILGALILAPFVAFFGLFMLGLAFGLSLIAAGAVTTMARQAKEADAETVDAEPVQKDAPDAEAQPA